MKLYIAIENGMCLNYINLHRSEPMRLRDTILTNASLKFETILYSEKEIGFLKILHPEAEIIKFNNHVQFEIYRNALELSYN